MLDKFLKKYNYYLPPELIAQSPAKPRDNARLLIYNRRSKKIRFDRFSNLGKYLPNNTVLVFNHTKVWPARLITQKPTGGKVELLYISRDKNLIKVLTNRKLTPKTLLCFIHGREFKKPTLRVVKKAGQFYFLKPSFSLSQLPDIIKKYGYTPLPPYIKNSPLTEKQKREQYQSIFAKIGLSVAAPTASLHFTKRLMNNLLKQRIGVKFVRLDVGLGTFAPLREDNLKTGKLHQEFYSIDRETATFLNFAKAQGRPIIAVGTTVARTLESAAADNHLSKLTGNTDLFIREGYKFKFINGLITNFHVPKSSLLMMVSAFAGRKTILDLYQRAINCRLRFFSFGDGMLLLP